MATKKTTKKSRPAKKSTRKPAKPATKRTSTRVAAKPRDPRLPAVGQKLTREFKGRTVEVLVTEEGFEYEDQTFKSISAVARRITGYPAISGPAFFRLDKPAEGK